MAGWRNEHAGFDAFGLGFGGVVAVRVALVDVKSVNDGGRVDQHGRVIGGFVHFEADGTEILGGFGLVHFIGGHKLRRIFGDVAGAEIVGITADDGDRFVNENPAAGSFAAIVALRHVDDIAGGGSFQGDPDGFQRRVFALSAVLFIHNGGGDIPVRRRGGDGERQGDKSGQQFFHAGFLFDK